MWIVDGEKYALVGLGVAFEGAPPPVHIAPNLWVLTETTLDVPSVWREWLGSIRAGQVADSNLFLVSKLASETPEVLDVENRLLQERVKHFYTGLLLSAMFSPSHSPMILTGARRDGTTDVRQHTELEQPAPQIIRPYPQLTADNIVMAAQIGQKINSMRPEAASYRLWRFIRTLGVYIEARTTSDPLDRIHQYCRCIEGLIMPSIGKTRQQFKSRTELFIGPTHHRLMGALYDIRSAVEHLHEDRYLEPFERDVRLDLAKKEAIVEHIARTALAQISARDTLWQHFGNTAALREFWALSPDERRQIWGAPIDPMASLKGFDPSTLSDEMLGAPSATDE